jgi:hypothetical protein
MEQMIAERLPAMVGVEYTVLQAQAPIFFLIGKHQRTSTTRTTLIASYYILEGSIFMAPRLSNIIEGRLASSMFYLREAIKYAGKHLSFDTGKRQYHVRTETEDLSSAMNTEEFTIYSKIIAGIEEH